MHATNFNARTERGGVRSAWLRLMLALQAEEESWQAAEW